MGDDTQVYVGLGGNIGDSVAVLNEALHSISKIKGVYALRCSSIYRTTPVSEIPQEDYANAVCTFKTTLGIYELHGELCRIEKELGKIPKPRDYPRIIDLDLLFFGAESIETKDLTVPHSGWDERLFVLVPLSDLAAELSIPGSAGEPGIRKVNVKELLKNFSNTRQEKVSFLAKPSLANP